ncbi:VanZ family protein [Kangiella sp. HZ709]|uniref:VanZ family protein n=1 Tax=Kangiella sp. HZ709 TaxID=2666328 RepID=UPI0012B0C77C|nr:VanZ family protein [Kangiella sp. HZ709]MRX28012.1 VanZ family protein [Kangiella sp. HZ709]
MRLIWLTVIILIAYGSLYPFNFDFNRSLPTDLVAWLQNWEQRTIRSDLIANILLFIPFGFLGALNIQQDGRRSPLLSAIWLVFMGVGFALSLQILQFYLPSRVPHAADALVNSIGILLGISVAAYTNSQRIRRLIPQQFQFHLTPALLVLCLWLGWAFFPYIPVFETKQIGIGIESVYNSQWYWQDWLKFILFWLMFYLSFSRVMNRDYSINVLLVVTIFILAIKLSMFWSQIGWSEISAVPLAVILHRSLSGQFKFMMIALLAALILLLEFVFPFQWITDLGTLNTIQWIPFKKFLGGSTWFHLSNLFQYSLLVTSLGYALARWFSSYRLAFLFVMLLILLLSTLQLFLQGQSPDVTDWILALVLMTFLERVDSIRR